MSAEANGRGSEWAVLGLVGLVLAVLACRAPVTSTPAPTVVLPTETGVPAETVAPIETVTPAGTAEPTPTPPPTATAIPPTDTPAPPSPTPSGQAEIDYFRARGAGGALLGVADPGETITLEWRWSGGPGATATIYHMFGFQLSDPHWDVGPQGSQEYTVPSQARNYERFVLYVNDAQGLAAQESLEIELRCPDAWFFEPAPDVCPAGPPLVTEGAEQHFQRGAMVWNRAEDRIYVLFADGQDPAWQAYEDRFDEGQDPERDPTIEPPEGLYQPIRGFGLVWREQSGVRDRLGWAVDAEDGYQTAIQRTSYVKYNDTYIRALEGGVWRLGPEYSEWEAIGGAALPATPAAAAGETPVPTPDCQVLPEGGFLAVWQAEPGLQAVLGCPTSHHPRIEPAAWEVSTAYQPFQSGGMIWTDQTGWYQQPVVYVLYGDGTYQRFDDTWDPQLDPESGGETPPGGLFEPIRGFGQVWREQLGVRDQLGWATGGETGGQGRFQMFTGGDMVWISQTGRTYVFSAGSVWVFDVPFGE